MAWAAVNVPRVGKHAAGDRMAKFMYDLYPIVIFSNGLFDYEILLADFSEEILTMDFLRKYRNQAQKHDNLAHQASRI